MELLFGSNYSPKQCETSHNLNGLRSLPGNTTAISYRCACISQCSLMYIFICSFPQTEFASFSLGCLQSFHCSLLHATIHHPTVLSVVLFLMVGMLFCPLKSFFSLQSIYSGLFYWLGSSWVLHVLLQIYHDALLFFRVPVL